MPSALQYQGSCLMSSHSRALSGCCMQQPVLELMGQVCKQ